MTSHSEDQRRMGEKIRAARRAKGWSQEDLSDRVGVRASTVSSWERGTARIRVGHCKALARELGLTISQLNGVERMDITPLTVAKAPELAAAANLLGCRLLTEHGPSGPRFQLEPLEAN